MQICQMKDILKMMEKKDNNINYTKEKSDIKCRLNYICGGSFKISII